MVRIPTDRVPTHPGEMLLEEFLNPLGLTQRELAAAIHVPYQRVNELVNGRRGIAILHHSRDNPQMNADERRTVEARRAASRIVQVIQDGYITPSTALRLAKYLDVSPAFWLNLQLRWDLYHATQSEAQALETIEPLNMALEV